MMQLTSNLELTREDFTKKVGAYKRVMKSAMQEAGIQFKDFIVRTQMSGRPGLRRKSGRLIRDFKVKTVSNANEGFQTIVTNDSEYIMYHQTGAKHLPKRLRIYEELQKTGVKMFEKAANKAIKELEK